MPSHPLSAGDSPYSGARKRLLHRLFLLHLLVLVLVLVLVLALVLVLVLVLVHAKR